MTIVDSVFYKTPRRKAEPDKPKPLKVDGALSCPFDGSDAIWQVDPGSYGYVGPKKRIKCVSCGCASPYEQMEEWERGRGTYSIDEKATASCLEWWNRRP